MTIANEAVRVPLDALTSGIEALEARLGETLATLVATAARTTHADFGEIEVRTCSDCHEPFPAWRSAPETEKCPSCTLLTPSLAHPPTISLRHDTPNEMAAAIVVHEVLRHYAVLVGEPAPPTWNEAPDYITSPLVALARTVIADRATTPETAHKQWQEQFTAAGWRFGLDIDPIKKLHPLVRDWGALSDTDRRRLRIAVGVIAALT